MTTPPGSYESFRQRRRRRTYKINPRTAVAVQTIRCYADENGLAVWDMYNTWRYPPCLPQLAGSRIDASGPCTLFAGRLPPARRAVLQALLKAYNDYVEYLGIFIRIEYNLDRLRDVFTYDPQAPMIFSSGIFLWLFVAFILVYLLLQRRTTARLLFCHLVFLLLLL